MLDLSPCPFCGGEAEFERMGTPRQSCIVACTDCGGRAESNEEGGECGSQWNARYTPDGWQLVPVEPTAGMMRALWQADPLDRHAAMLAAAPKPGGEY